MAADDLGPNDPCGILTLEQLKFAKDKDGNIVIRVYDSSGKPICLDNVNRDYVSAAYPDAVTEVYTYRLGGAAGAVTEIITVVYTDATKENLDSVAVT